MLSFLAILIAFNLCRESECYSRFDYIVLIIGSEPFQDFDYTNDKSR